MKKTIPFEVFGANQFIYFDINRLMRLEQLLGKSITHIVAVHDITIDFLVKSLMVGLSHHSRDNAAQWTNKLKKFFDDGGSIEELAEPILLAIIGSGIFGKIETDDDKENGEEKNAPATAEPSE